MLKLYLILGIVCVVGAAGAYVNNLQHSLSSAIENNAMLTQAAETNQSTITALQKDLLVQQQISAKLTKNLQVATQEKTALLQKLQKHDLTRIALEKPKLLEDRVNAATAKVFNDIELTTAE